MSTIKSYVLKLSFLLMAGLSPLLVLADPGGAYDDPDEPEESATPIDGGATLLLAAGAGYGIKKLYDLKKAK